MKTSQSSEIPMLIIGICLFLTPPFFVLFTICLSIWAGCTLADKFNTRFVKSESVQGAIKFIMFLLSLWFAMYVSELYVCRLLNLG